MCPQARETPIYRKRASPESETRTAFALMKRGSDGTGFSMYKHRHVWPPDRCSEERWKEKTEAAASVSSFHRSTRGKPLVCRAPHRGRAASRRPAPLGALLPRRAGATVYPPHLEGADAL